MVDYIVKKMKAELQEYSADASQEVKVIATGGLATLIDGRIDCIDYVDKMLTLEGLESYTERIKNQKKEPGPVREGGKDCNYAEDSF